MTPLQSKALAFIAEFNEQRGFSPSFEEIRLGLRLKSKSEVQRLVYALEALEKIKRFPHRARSIEVRS